MRNFIGAALLILGLFLAAPSLAVLLEDPIGDQVFRIEGMADAPVPLNSPISADLASLEVQEEEDWLRFSVKIHDEATPITVMSARIFEIFFTVGEQKYLLATHEPSAHVNEGPGLFRVDAQGENRWVAPANRVTSEENFHEFLAPREHVWDENGALLAPGHVVSDFSVNLRGSQIYLAGVMTYPSDTLPNDPTPETLEVQFGSEQSSRLQLATTYPSRYSNGEEASFIYPFSALNLGDEYETIRFAWDTPAGWTAQISANEISLSPGEKYSGFLVANVPFRHDHGATEQIVLRGEDTLGNKGQVSFQVRFLAVPQPAGHHNQLFIHAKPYNSDLIEDMIGAPQLGYMNTLQVDPEATGEPVRAVSNGRPLNDLIWHVPLAPSLLLGLDSPGGEGNFSGQFQSEAPHLGATLAANVVHISIEGDETLLAVGQSDPQDMAAGEKVGFSVPLAMSEIRLPPQDGAQLLLKLEMIVTQPTFVTAREVPVLHPGGTFSLPMREYRDAPDEIPGLLSTALSSSPFSETALANAGSAFILRPALDSNQRAPVEVKVQGNAAQFSTIIGDSTFEDPEFPLEVPVVLSIPDQAKVGEVFDLLVVFEQNNQHTYSRFTFTVVNEPVNDMAEEAEELIGSVNESAPMPPLGFLVALIVLARKLT
jgi:hypothetical protein